MATETRSNVHVIKHDNHTPPNTLTFRSFGTKTSVTFIFSNISSATTMLLSFDGTNTFTVKPGGVFTMNFSAIPGYWDSGDASGVCEVIIGSEV